MATGIKKGVDPKLLTHIMWAAWGVINIEQLGREPRRNYLMTVRAELETRGYELQVGGIAQRPFYRIFKGSEWSSNNAGVVTQDGFSHVCKAFLMKEDPDHASPDAGSAVTG